MMVCLAWKSIKMASDIRIIPVGETYGAKLTIFDPIGRLVSGATPFVKLVRDSDGFYYDWGSNAFVNAGGADFISMTEIGNTGTYIKEINPNTLNIAPASYTSIYKYDIGGVEIFSTESVVWSYALSNRRGKIL